MGFLWDALRPIDSMWWCCQGPGPKKVESDRPLIRVPSLARETAVWTLEDLWLEVRCMGPGEW